MAKLLTIFIAAYLVYVIIWCLAVIYFLETIIRPRITDGTISKEHWKEYADKVVWPYMPMFLIKNAALLGLEDE